MSAKTRQVGFRATEELADSLRDIAHEERTSVQAIIEEAVDDWLARGGKPKKRDPFAGLPAEEAAFARDIFENTNSSEKKLIRQLLVAIRYGDPDLAEACRMSIRSAAGIAEKHFMKDHQRRSA